MLHFIWLREIQQQQGSPSVLFFSTSVSGRVWYKTYLWITAAWKKLLAAFWCSVCTLLTQANKQEGKAEGQGEAHVPSFAPEDIPWAARGSCWRQRDILWLSWLEGKWEHALRTCNSASRSSAERNRKKVARGHTATITAFLFSSSENKPAAGITISEMNSKDKNHLTWKTL